jgi:ectoine hydroxylase-related dioxygenase (phytanoyl-CoA dioxygenase family)
MIYVGSVWHGGGANTTDHARLGVAIEYVAGWLRPQETQLLAVSPETARGLSPRLQELLGYNVYPPFLGYVDGRHPRRVLEG